MAVIVLKVVVAGLAEVRTQFDRLKIHRSTTGQLGVYTELTDPGTRIALEEGRVIYEFMDQAGSPSYFYRVSYYNALSGLESSLSEPQQGEQDAALDIISVEDLKTNFLFGVDLTDDQGVPYPDSLYEFYVKSAVSFLEAKLDLPLRPTRYVGEMHDYYRSDFRTYGALFLDHYQVIEMEKLAMVLPGTATETVFDPSWISLQKESGQLHLVPSSGSLFGQGMAGAIAGIGYSMFSRDFIPDVFRATYTAGFEAGKVPAAIRELVGKIASYGPLNIAGDLVGGAGLQGSSLSIDGLSQSITTTNSSTNAGFGARLLMYRKEVKDQIDVLRNYFKGLRMRVA